MKINKISPLESKYTEVLETLVLNIKMLYYYGKMPKMGVKNGNFGEIFDKNSHHEALERPRTVAIVGARKNTAYGEEVAYKAAYEAAKAGAVIVSGLAYGIDSVAHRGALDANGVTLAVLGTPIDDIYPRTHKKLAQEIIESGGAVISEYGPEENASGGLEIRTRFLMRNRIIAGLADVVLVVEAAARSGSLNTATHALNFGKTLFAVPGDINKIYSEGCNKLLVQGALPYTEPEDLLDVLFPVRAKKMTKKARLEKLAGALETETERRIIAALLVGEQNGDKIVDKGGISVMEFSQAITMLEIKGVVKALGMNKWMVRC